VSPTQSVVLTSTLSFVVYLLAGPKADQRFLSIWQKRAGKAVAPAYATSVGVVTAWAFLSVFLIVLTDIPATAPVAVGLGWLLLISLLLTLGPDAMAAVTRIVSNPPATQTEKRQ
jgi:hypothetical protein